MKYIVLLAFAGLNLVLGTKLNMWCSGFVTGILVAMILLKLS